FFAWAQEAEPGFEQKMDQWFGDWIVNPIATVLFWTIPGIDMPVVVAWLALGAVFFTLRMGFVNVRMFGHAIALVRGKYDSPNAKGEVSHFQALTAALSATVGLGNIAGVAIAVGTGGPGATFWMLMFGLFGMSAKFAEVTLGQKFRHQRPDGSMMGGAMYYLSDGLRSMGAAGLGKVLAVAFAILCIGGSFGGGNSFQVKQSLDQIKELIPILQDNPWIYGLVMVVAVGVVIIGGIRRIATVADKIVPFMCTLYVLACLYIILAHAGHIPAAFKAIIEGAFAPDAAVGGFVGVLVLGIKRAAFSNEAGIGSAAIAHAAAKVEYPVQEGIVALLEPFIDTVVVCTMTALVIVITGAYENPAYEAVIKADQGAALTSYAMAEVVSWFPYVLSCAVVLFAYSTMISWSYYGERCWTWLFGERATMVYRVLFLAFTFLGSVVAATNILTFSDLMILGMSVPNVLGVVIMSGMVWNELSAYTAKLKSGEVKRHD
ncbi:MAG: sodium:alanine symporter family protein, partial [Myxococcales bacterium]|nr:sodium:alanine symporter family protein [Myxococcales bacterium]